MINKPLENPNIDSFASSFTSNLPKLFFDLKISICISTYQAGKLIFISPNEHGRLSQLPRHFEKPMGFGFTESFDKMAVASKDTVTLFTSSKELAYHYPKKEKVYDCMFFPRITYHTSALDMHDVHFGENETIFAVNTLFSCIVTLDSNYNFTPYWKPKQINELLSEDRCHLNGMAMQNGKPKYASAFNEGNSAKSWKEEVTTSGVIYDIEKNEVIARNLPMPHSPKIYKDELYVLLSATGEFVKIDTESGKYDVIIKLDGFVRGLSFYKDFAFIGLSKLRKGSSTFSKLEFSHAANESGFVVIQLSTKKLIGKFIYDNTVDEIYDLHVLPNSLKPNILNTLNNDYKGALMIPNATYWSLNKEED